MNVGLLLIKISLRLVSIMLKVFVGRRISMRLRRLLGLRPVLKGSMLMMMMATTIIQGGFLVIVGKLFMNGQQPMVVVL